MKNTKSNILGVAIGALFGCSSQTAAVDPGDATRAKGGRVEVSTTPSEQVNPATGRPQEQVIKIHPGDSWYKFRGDWLGMSTAQVRERDAAMTADEAPRGFWDEQVAVESVGLWSGLCNDCHGGRRRMADARLIPAPPEGWGTGNGVFFGRTKSRAEVFRTIHGGGAPSKDAKTPAMPAWGDKLAREQIWGMIYFVEYFSGGIEGRFPPGLYPKAQQQ